MQHLSPSFSRNGNSEEKKNGVGWPEYRSLPHGEMGTLITSGPKQVRPHVQKQHVKCHILETAIWVQQCLLFSSLTVCLF